MTNSQTAADLFQISGYTIAREVGRGGIATVYLAVQESLQREVALKIMAPALTSDPNFTRRFMHEGLTIARLNHPGIVTIYDISVDGHQHYIAMEFLKGGSLKSRLSGGMPREQALDVLHQVSSALEYAHDQQVVHRDVKPENIMFREHGTSEAVLTDFGIAKTGTQQSNITRAGLVVGTPRYMSPEQAEGKGASERSDIYALGVILHEMLTGRPPFKGTESMAVLYSHLHDPVPELPGPYRDLQPLLDDMMAKDPGRRIPDCGTLIDRIEEHITELPGDDATSGGAQAVEISTRGYRSGGKRRGRLTAILAWSGVSLAVALVASTMFWEFTRPEAETESDEYALPDGEPPQIVTPKKVDLTLAAGTPSVEDTEDVAAPPAEDSLDIGPLLKLAGQQFRQDRLSTPPDDNALDTYNVILKMQPGNADALQGLQQIAARYEELARIKLAENNPAEAESFVRIGLTAWPRHAGLRAVRDEIARRSNAKEENFAQKYPDTIRSYIIAAEAGNAAVQFQLALALANGEGVARDDARALYWFEKAAQQGHVKAKYNLALGKLFGHGADPAGAGRWMASAADGGYRPAYRVLGWMYTTGTGVKKSAKDAVLWSARGTKWTRPPHRADVVGSWQAGFEQAYMNSIIKVREQKMVESQDLH